MRQARPLLIATILCIASVTLSMSIVIHWLSDYDNRLEQTQQKINKLELNNKSLFTVDNSNGAFVLDNQLSQSVKTVNQLKQNQLLLHKEISAINKRIDQLLALVDDHTVNDYSEVNDEFDLELDIDQLSTGLSQQDAIPLETNFYSQQIDPQWAIDTANWIEENSLRSQFKNTEVLDLECRRSTCRMTVSHKDFESHSLFNLEFPQLVSSQFRRVSMDQEELAGGGMRTIIYLDAS